MRNILSSIGLAQPVGRLETLITFVCLLCLATPACSMSVGFEQIKIPLSDGDFAEGAIWFPSSSPEKPLTVGPSEQQVAQDGAISGTRLPLVVFSHGALGSWSSNLDTAFALAQAGFVSAALTYDKPAYDGVMRIAQHGQRLSALIDFALHRWHYHESINPEKIGAFGFSLGGFTLLTEIGGKPDLTRIRAHCLAAPSEWSCKAFAGHHLDIGMTPEPALNWAADTRIKAAVIAAPALGYLFEGDGLAAVHVPVQLWEASDDTTLAEPWNVEAVRRSLPLPPEFHLVIGADHGDFGSTCLRVSEQGETPLCKVNHDFDRAAFHMTFNMEIASFLRNSLSAR